MNENTNFDIKSGTDSQTIYKTANDICIKYADNPMLAAQNVIKLLECPETGEAADPYPAKLQELMRDLLSKVLEAKIAAPVDEDEMTQKEIALKSEIDGYYLRQELVKAILKLGHIPKDSYETVIGVGFIDIVDYSYLSNWLSPKENQVVLNGLYSAFNLILKKRGGYLNKMEGDSLMFHYGGLIDPKSRDLSQDDLEVYLARELFYTCIEMQKACSFFNEADKRFITENTDQETREHLQAAFLIISTLRENLVFASAINALFQIKIRVGASIGEVCIGNFGPQGAKQWDIIGNPVIEAKRMEMTAPVEGIRISENFYKILEKTGISEQYFREFKEEAERANGYFRDITKEELFRFREVRIKEKKNIRFNTYKVYVNPGLPETIAKHVEALLFKQEDGADKIIEIVQYNRGSKHVMEAVEDLFAGRKIELNKPELLKIVLPKKYADLLQQRNGDCGSLNAYINRKFSLFDIVNVLSMYQDCMHAKMENREKRKTTFSDYNQYLAEEIHSIHMNYKSKKKTFDQNAFFWQVAYPSFFMVIKAGVIDYQKRIEESEPVEIAV